MMSLDDLRLHNAARKRAIEAMLTLSPVPPGQPNPAVEQAIRNRDADFAVDVTQEVTIVSMVTQLGNNEGEGNV